MGGLIALALALDSDKTTGLQGVISSGNSTDFPHISLIDKHLHCSQDHPFQSLNSDLEDLYLESHPVLQSIMDWTLATLPVTKKKSTISWLTNYAR